MAAERDSLRFYVDESALGVGKALAAARTDTVHVGHKLVPECPLGVLDVDWMPVVAALGLVVICRDRRLRTRPAELQTLKAAGLRVLCTGGKRDLTTWEWLVRIVKHWGLIEDIIESEGAGPWFFVINDRNLTRLEV